MRLYWLFKTKIIRYQIIRFSYLFASLKLILGKHFIIHHLSFYNHNERERGGGGRERERKIQIDLKHYSVAFLSRERDTSLHLYDKNFVTQHNFMHSRRAPVHMYVCTYIIHACIWSRARCRQEHSSVHQINTRLL